MTYRMKLVSLTVAVMLLLPLTARAANIAITGSTRYETHTLKGTKAGDTMFTTAFTFIKKTSAVDSVMATIGHRLNLDDGGSDGLALGLSYLRNLTRSTYVMAGYSNYRLYENQDNGRLDDTADTLSLTHGWKVIKKDIVNLWLYTSFNADTRFDNNRMFSETMSFSGPVGKDLKWGASYQFGYSLVDHRHSINSYDFKVARKISRRSQLSLGHRTVHYLSAIGSDLGDSQWLLYYNYRIR